MENYHPKLQEYTISPDHNSVISKYSHVRRIFNEMHCRGDIKLGSVLQHGQQQNMYWLCMDKHLVKAALPVFRNESNLQNGTSAAVRFCNGNELICHDDTYYLTYLNKRGELGIKMIQCFLTEELVRYACMLRNHKVLSVRLVKFFVPDDPRPLTVCWEITYYKDEVDYGFIFADLRDGIVLEGYDFSECEVYPVDVGDYVLAYDTYYKLEKSAQNTLYLRKSHLQIELGGTYAPGLS